MSISPQAMAALKKRIDSLSARAAARSAGPPRFAISECGEDGRIIGPWPALPPGEGFALIVIPAGRFLPAGPPGAWEPQPDPAAAEAARTAHLQAAAAAAEAGQAYPDFRLPPVAYRVALQDAPAPPAPAIRAPIKAQVVSINPKLQARRAAQEAFRKRFGGNNVAL